MTLTPAHGRDYKSKAAVEKDFRDGKDFIGQDYRGSGYCSIRDFPKGTQLTMRYRKNTMAFILTV